ncbi:hypothetical protein MRX96_033646 [Rhipicephalus microplus]
MRLRLHHGGARSAVCESEGGHVRSANASWRALLPSVPGFRDVQRRPPSSPPSQLLAVCTRQEERRPQDFAIRTTTTMRPGELPLPHFTNSAGSGAAARSAVYRIAPPSGTGYRHKTASGEGPGLCSPPSRPTVVVSRLIPVRDCRTRLAEFL